MIASLSDLVIAGLALLPLAAAQVQTLTSDGCVDPSGFDSCYSGVNNAAELCFNNNCSDGTCTGPDDCTTGDANCVTSCLAGAYQGWITCAMAHCWNRAYSCEYQALEIAGIMASDFALSVAPSPYFSPPPNAPGSCSCNTDAVFAVIHETLNQADKCSNTISNGNFPASEGEVCNCCAASLALSALPNICPNVAYSSLPQISQMSNFQTAVNTFQDDASCSASADPSSQDCAATPFDFNNFGTGSTYYGPDNLPADGTLGISDLPGELTAPLSATIFWSYIAGGPVATAIAAKASAGSGGSGGSSGSGGSGGGASGAGPTATSGSGGGASSGSIAAVRVPDALFVIGCPALLAVAVILGI